jgi:hypothetical protein
MITKLYKKCGKRLRGAGSNRIREINPEFSCLFKQTRSSVDIFIFVDCSSVEGPEHKRVQSTTR